MTRSRPRGLALGLFGAAALARGCTACTGGQRATTATPEPPALDGALDAEPDAASEAGGPRLAGGAFVHLFEWTWTDIAKECELFLGPKGFAAVQVSPPSEHAILSGYPWWQRYQTVGYGLDKSRSGTKAEFVAMVQACAKAGVDVYVDAVINHMTSQVSGVGSNGTAFQKYDYPGLFAPGDFHQPPCQIAPADYTTSALHVQTCELFRLADLNTGADQVRSAIASYLVALVEIGVKGFRIDAAKHISPADLDAILARVANGTSSSPRPYYFFEVTAAADEVIHPSDYFDVGRNASASVGVTEFGYSAVGDAFLNRAGVTLAQLRDLGSPAWGLLPSDRAVVFTANHDTQRASAIDYKDAPYNDLATVFMLAWPYGYPSILSGYAFDRDTQQGKDMGPPSDADGHTQHVYAATSDTPSCPLTPSAAAPGSWTCEHRARSAANMIAFRRATAAAPSVDGWWDNGANQIAFGRGDLGFVIINRESAPLHHTFKTPLMPGAYCDVLAGDFSGNACSGPIVNVDASGSIDVTVPAGEALAIHVGARVK
jgi:alpha-amylase